MFLVQKSDCKNTYSGQRVRSSPFEKILGIWSFVLAPVPPKRLGTQANTKLRMPKVFFSR